jgi:outer membrane protein
MAVILMSSGHRSYAETFTLSQVYSLALKKHEEIKIAQEDIRYAEQEKRRAFSAVFPRLTAIGTYTRSPEEFGASENVILQPEESYGVEVRLEQSLYAGGKNRAGIRIANHGIQVADKNFNLSSEALLLRTAQVYYDTLKAQKNLEAQKRNVERLREHRRLSELRYKVGEVTESVLLRAEAELAGALAELVALENELVVKKRELMFLADLPETFEIQEPPLPEIPSETGRPLQDLALGHRDDLKRSELQGLIAQEQVRFARGNFLPSLSLEGTYFNRNQDPLSTFFIDESWFVGAKLEFPFFEGGLRRAELAQARSRLSQNQLATEKLKKDIDLDVTRAALTLEALSRVLESRQEQNRFATKNYEMVSKQFTFGLVTNIDLLDANQTLIESERDVISATYDRHVAILNLQRSIGVFLPKALETAKTGL